MSQGEPLLVEVIAYAPTAYYHCTHCEVAWRAAGVSNKFHEEQVDSSLPPEMAQEYQSVSDWVREVFKQYCDGVIIKVIDAASIEGLIKSVQYHARHYPAVIIDRKHKYTLSQLADATHQIGQLLSVQDSEKGGA